MREGADGRGLFHSEYCEGLIWIASARAEIRTLYVLNIVTLYKVFGCPNENYQN
jgi:hypothetical protein